MLDSIELSILENGYVPNGQLWRRWIMAQVFRHRQNGITSFFEHFIDNKSYSYEWSTVRNELKTMSKLPEKERKSRERFFNASVLISMTEHYKNHIFDYLSENSLKYTKSIFNSYVSNTKELTNMADRLIRDAEKIKDDGDLKRLCISLDKFLRIAPMPKHMKKSNAWINAFIGSGAYYTMDNMIKFHNCHIKSENNFLNTADSLRELDKYTAMYSEDYIKLYDFMQDFIAYNNFDFKEAMYHTYETDNL